MKCRTCDTEIADKAIICYRCGTATSTPRVTPPGDGPSRGAWPLVAALLVLIGAAALALPHLPEGAPQMTGLVTVLVAAVLVIRRLRPTPRRSRLLGRRRP